MPTQGESTALTMFTTFDALSVMPPSFSRPRITPLDPAYFEASRSISVAHPFPSPGGEPGEPLPPNPQTCPDPILPAPPPHPRNSAPSLPRAPPAGLHRFVR